MTMHFFGDSWAAGCELNGYITHNLKRTKSYNKQLAHALTHENNCIYLMKELAYPSIVGNMLNEPIDNHGITASSQDRMLYEFNNANIIQGDDAVFALTAPSRKSCLSDNNEIIDIQWDESDKYLNEYNNDWRSAQTCLLLYFLCNKLGINAWFFNVFTTIDIKLKNDLWNIIPDDRWLIPKHENIISRIFDKHISQWSHEGNLFDWIMTENDAVKKYIRPCKAHPNLEGHQKIAEYIASELKNRKNLLRDK